MKSPELTEFFSLLGKAKKEKKEEFDNLLKEADINLDALTSSVVTGIKEAKVNIKKQKKKEEKLIEQLDSIIDVIENPKEIKDITEPAVTVGVPEDFDVSSLEDADDNPSFEVVDLIKPEPIKTPKISDTVAQAIKFIEETNLKEEIENSDETSLDNLKSEIKQVRDILYKVLAHGPGSGEVNLLKLDDVDEDTAKVDGKFLKYDSSSGKFVGADASGGSADIAGISTTGTSVFNQINASGITTVAQLSGFSHLIAPHGSTTTITVTVVTKTTAHRYYGTGSSQGYALDNVESPFLTLTPGRTYRFSGSVAGSHPFRFYLDAAKATAYTTGVTVGSGYVDLEVTDSTPTVLHYQCSSHGYMGNAIQVNSSNAIKLNSQAASYYLDYDNFSNTPTIPSNNNQLTNGAGYITTSFTNTNQLTNGAGFIDGSSLNASNLSSGTIPDARFPSALPAIDGSALTGVGGTANVRTGILDVAGISTFRDDINLPDNVELKLGSAGEVRLFHSGVDTKFIMSQHYFNMQANGYNFLSQNGSETLFTAFQNGAVNLFFDNTKRFETTNTGAKVTGDLEITGVLTYEDVTNVDSIGVITARSGVLVGSGITLSPDGDGFFTGVTTSITSSVIGSNTSPLTIGAVSSHHLTVANDNASMILGKSNSDALYLRRNFATGRYVFQTFNGGNDGSIALQPFGGKVGIASAIPTSTLDVNGDVRVGSGVTISPDGDIFAVGVSTFTNNIHIPDDSKILMGDNNDFRIFHNPDNSLNYIVAQNNGPLLLRSSNADMIHCSPQGAVTLKHNGSTKIQTANTGAVVTGILTATSDVNVGSGITLSPDGNVFTTGISTFTGAVGIGSTLSIGNEDILLRHDPDMFGDIYNEMSFNNGNVFFVNKDTSKPYMYIRSNDIQLRDWTNNRAYIHCANSLDVKLYYNGSARLQTTDAGVTVTGTVSATTGSFTNVTGDLTGDVTGTSTSAQGLTGSPNITVTNVNAVDAIISGNLSVAGTITSLDQNDISVTGIMTASGGVDLGDPGIVTLSSDTLTTTSSSADTVASVSATVNRSATFQVQVTRGTEYHVTTINVVHDGTNAFLSEYGTIRTGSILATFDADISGGNLRLRATPTSTASTVFKLSKTVIKV